MVSAAKIHLKLAAEDVAGRVKDRLWRDKFFILAIGVLFYASTRAVGTLREAIAVGLPRKDKRDAGKHDPERGRYAQRPMEMPKAGWRDIALRIKTSMSRDNLSMIAAGVAFYAMMALFPGLFALVALYGLLFDPNQVSQQVGALGAMLPKEAADLIVKELHDLVSTNGAALGAGVLIGVVTALWSASQGIRTLMQALNVAYGEKEKRGTVQFYATGLALTLGGIVWMSFIIGLLVAIPVAAKFLTASTGGEALVSLLRWPIIAIAVMIGLAVLYRYAPSRDHPRWQWVSPGAIFATITWLVGSALFSFYVGHFGSYNKTYGAAGAVVILLTWLLLSAYVILIGAEINAESERQTRKDTTVGPAQPLGRRGAYAADTVGRTP
jgi:membrane protein